MSWFQSLQADDLDAINRYVTGTPVRTPQAQQAVNGWIEWFDTRSAWQKQFDRVTFDEARNRRLAFELANATTDAERADVQRRANEGLSAEEMQSEADRRQSGGHYSEKAPEGWSPTLGLFGLAIVASAAGTAYLLRRR